MSQKLYSSVYYEHLLVLVKYDDHIRGQWEQTGELKNKIPIIFVHKVLLQSMYCEKKLKNDWWHFNRFS